MTHVLIYDYVLIPGLFMMTQLPPAKGTVTWTVRPSQLATYLLYLSYMDHTSKLYNK